VLVGRWTPEVEWSNSLVCFGFEEWSTAAAFPICFWQVALVGCGRVAQVGAGGGSGGVSGVT